MTVSSTTVKKSYNGNGSTAAFTYDFLINTTAELKVIIRSSTGTETVKTLSSHYNISDSSGSGTVTFTSGNIPANGETVILIRDTDLTQGTDYVENDPFPSASHESALDKLTLQVQEVQEELDRAIKLSRTNTMTSTEFTVGATERASKILAFDSSGEISVTQELGTVKGNWGASTTYAIRDIVKDTSTNNIFIALTAHTSSGSQPLTTNTDSAKWSLLVDAAAATTSATNAASSATAAANSATASATSATAAASSETDAQTAQTAAETAQTAAETAKTAAETAKTNAETSETNAATSATTASTQATNSANSATASATSATAAANSASAASTSETNAASSETAAAGSATTATNQATAASTSATNAATSASNASTSETNAANSATNSSNSATASATSATNASNSATAAATSAASAAAAYDTFDDRYLGSKTSNPSVDNDGNALVTGALYFNSSANEMRVFDGGNWIAASSAGTASLILYEYTATSGQTTFSGSDDNSATLSYSVDNLQVVLNGVILDPSDYTATSGTSIVLGSGAATGDLLNVYAFKSFTVSELNANNLNDGIVPIARLGTSGTKDATTFLRGDNTFATITVPAGTTINNNADNRVITGSGTANTLEGESNLVFDGTNLGLGEASPSAQLHIKGSDITDQVIIENTDSGAETAPDITLYRSSSSPADNDTLANIIFRGKNDAAEDVNYFEMTGVIADASDGSEDTQVEFSGKNGGSNHTFMKFVAGGIIESGSSIIPSTNNAVDLGSSSKVWRNIYTSDLNMSNEYLDKGNDVDGSKGSWTFQEGADDLFLLNNKNGKKYKFNLTEIK